MAERIAAAIEGLNIAIGRAVAWLALLMVLATFAVVVLRYAFDAGWIWMQQSVTWMHAALFMLAAPYTLAREGHVRVDVFYGRLRARGRAVVDLAGTLLFLAPMAAFIAVESFDYAAVSWAIGEGSREAGGLGFPVPSLVKSLMPLTAALLLLQAVVIALRSAVTLAGPRRRG